jgi:hypothetical protein
VKIRKITMKATLKDAFKTELGELWSPSPSEYRLQE